MLWIDGVGAWLLCCGTSIDIGGPSQADDAADLRLMGPLSRRHATFQYIDDAWFLNPHQPCCVGKTRLSAPRCLYHNDQIILGEKVQLRFQRPSVLSASAVLQLESFHQPAQSVQGILLVVDSILLGSRADHHVHCADWPERLILLRRDGRFYCRSEMSLQLNQQPLTSDQELGDGAIVSGTDLCFRLQKL
jgi:hypothetical protein